MATRRPRLPRVTIGLVLASVLSAAAPYARQAHPDAAAALGEMVGAERAFAARALVVGWKQAFLEYFALDAVAFDGDRTVSALGRFRRAADPPKDLQLIWEPRFGDISADGDLGWLTGPTTTINPGQNNGAPRYGNYASVWKRQAGGTFKVVLDLGTTVPEAAPFPPGFTRAAAGDRYQGEAPRRNAILVLREAETNVNRATTQSIAAALHDRVTADARVHRRGRMPIVGATAIAAWAQSEPRWQAAASRGLEVASSRDLAYTYGTYAASAPTVRTVSRCTTGPSGFPVGD